MKNEIEVDLVSLNYYLNITNVRSKTGTLAGYIFNETSWIQHSWKINAVNMQS